MINRIKTVKISKQIQNKRQKLSEHDKALDLQDLMTFTLIVYGCRVVSGVVRIR